MSSRPTKTVIVTGGTRGVGRAIADRFADHGMNLAIAYGSDDDAAEAANAGLTERGGNVLMIKADIRLRAEVENLFEQVASRFGPIDVVVANAGVEVIDRPFADLEEDSLDWVVDTNLKGTFFTLQQAARHVVDGGRIIATSSTIPINPPEKAGVYAASKAAVRTMIDVLAKEMGPRGITVNSIAPGMVKGAGVFTRIDAELEAQAVDATPLGRMVVPADMGGLAVFLVSDDAAMINGQHLAVTGGASI